MPPSVLDKVRAAVTGETDKLAKLKKKLDEAKQVQSRYLSTWELNRAFYSGNQWVYWNRNKVEQPVLEPDSTRVLIEDNRITGMVRTEIAKMTKQEPTFTVMPTTPEQDDVQAAGTGEKILAFLWKHLGMSEKLENALLWSRVCGGGFLKVCWDSGAGDKFGVVVDNEGNLVQHPRTSAPMKPEHFPGGNDELQEQGLAAKTLATGDVHVEVVAPFEAYPDPLAKSLKECEWFIQVSIQSRDYVKQRWGVDIEVDTNIASGSPENRIPSSVESGAMRKGVRLYEYWERPSADNPQGRRAVWAKNDLLEDGPNPYRTIPFVMFRSIPVPGRFWPASIVELLRGPQVELNKIKSQIVENAQRIGNPSVLIANTSNTKMGGVPGEEIRYDDTTQNAKPEYMRPPDMPQYVIEQIDRIERSMQEISGQHEVSQAQVPPGVKAASAISMLQEADDTRLGPGIFDMENALSDLGTMLLELVAQYWTDERIIMISGENHALDVIPFKGAALKENTRAEVQSGSMLPQSKAARQASIESFLALAFQYEGSQAINPRMLSKVLKDLDQGAISKLYGDISQDEEQINRENREMSLGKPVKMHVYDNTQLHIEGHTEYQRTASYAALPKFQKALFELHTKEHREHFLEQMKPSGQEVQQHEETTETQPAGEEEQGEEQHEQQMEHADEQHDQKLQHAQEQHEQRLAQQRQQQRGRE